MSTVPSYTAVKVGGSGEPVARQQQRRVLVQDHVARAPGVALAHLHILLNRSSFPKKIFYGTFLLLIFLHRMSSSHIKETF